MKYVVYTHTDYSDVALVHSDHLKYDYNVLLINSNNMNLENLYNKFQEVIFYDDALPYAGRLLQGLNQLEADYILLIHDMDILLSVNYDMISKLLSYCKEKSIHRLDLKHECDPIHENTLVLNVDNFEKIKVADINNYNLCMVKKYYYNVNPSIWYKDALIDILSHFPDETYRTIENKQVSKYCEKYEMFIMHCKKCVNTGYFHVLPDFIFMHISHHGGMMPVNYDKMEDFARDKYNNMLKTYNNNTKWRN